MSRFINQLPRMRGPRVDEGLGTKFANKMRSAYSGFAHSSAYIPDRWALAWGRFAKDLAQVVVDYVAKERGGASSRALVKLVNSKSSRNPGRTNGSSNAVDSVAVENVAVDYGYYISKCRDLINRLYEKRNEYVAELDKSGFKDSESDPEVEALYRILTDSFVPERKNAGGESKRTEGRKMPFEDVWDMIGRFKDDYDKKGEVTNRVVQLMFDAASKGDMDPVSVARTAMQGVGASNAARTVR